MVEVVLVGSEKDAKGGEKQTEQRCTDESQGPSAVMTAVFNPLVAGPWRRSLRVPLLCSGRGGGPPPSAAPPRRGEAGGRPPRSPGRSLGAGIPRESSGRHSCPG